MPCSSKRKPSVDPGVAGGGVTHGAWREGLLVGLLAAVLFTAWLGARDLWNPNEPLYGQAVVEMAARGDLLVPTVNGTVFGEKPILYFWLALASARFLGGVDEFTLRLPSAVAGVASVLLVYWLVLPYAGRRRARLSALVLATTFVVFWSARQVQMDLLLAACTLVTVLGATRAIDRLWNAAVGWGLAGFGAGLGFLAKGPVGWLCPALVIVAYALVTRRVRTLFGVSPLLVGSAAFLGVAAPWFLMLWVRGETDLLGELLVRQNLTRFVDPWDHHAPWWYYLQYFWIDMAPWAWFVPLAWGLAADDERERRLQRLAWVWILAIVLFFTFSASKRSPYILPVAPAVAVLVAGVADRWLAGRLGRLRLNAGRALLGVLAFGFLAGAVVLVAGAPWVKPPDPVLDRAVAVMGTALAVGGLLTLVAVLVARSRAALAAVALFGALAGVYLAACASALPAANAFKSHRPLCEAIRSHVGPTDPLRGFHDWQWRAGYSFYLRRPIPPLATVEELQDYWGRPERVFLIVERGRLEEARRVLGPIAPLESRAVGSNFAYLFSNRD